MIVALAGGVGGAKLVDGLARVLSPSELVTVVNTGDDFEHLGLHISPDLDTVMYTLADRANPATGWGLSGETWRCMEALERVGGDTWFRLGDQDLATHLRRTALLASGQALSAATATLCAAFGVRHAIFPMSDDPVRTVVDTSEGELPFQEYFVHRHCEPVLRGLHYAGAAQARPATGLLDALRAPDLQAVVLCPSNPYLSIGPFLAMPQLRDVLLATRAPVIAVSPIVAGRAIKGPAAKIMLELGREASSLEVARYYGDLLDGFVLDHTDAQAASTVAALGITPLVTGTVMTGDAERARLAVDVLSFASRLRGGESP